MDESLYRFLKWTAIALGVAWVGWSIYESFVLGRAPGDRQFQEGEQLFSDGAYERAIAKYDRALEKDAGHIHAKRGKARALLQLDRFPQALELFNELVALEPQFAGSYANRGILHDRMGRYEKAIADYERALALDPELNEGPHWLTRFLRNQPEKPPGIGDRAAYLRTELAKPAGEQQLRIPDIDGQQRSYKQ